MIEEEKDRMKDITIDCSEESSDSEGEHMIVHKSVWRSRGKYFNITKLFLTYNCLELFLYHSCYINISLNSYYILSLTSIFM